MNERISVLSEQALLAGIESSESFTVEGAKKAFGVIGELP